MTEKFDLNSAQRMAVVLIVGVLVVSAVVPLLADARPAREIPAPTVDGDLSGTDAPGWDDVPAADVPLSAAPSGLPNADQVSATTVDVQAARSDGNIFVRMQWTDETKSTDASDPRSFADGAAVQIPVNTSTQPAIAMGSAGNLVNVWYWRADGLTEELVAGGPGSTTPITEGSIVTDASHEDDTWTVVYSRSLASDAPNRTAISDDSDLDIAFALWDGANMERSGQKAASDWYYLPLGPEPSGTPFESLLWALAGVALVVVILVTIQGIRRTRSGGGDT